MCCFSCKFFIANSLLKEWLLRFIDACIYLHLFLIYIAVDCGTLTNPVNGQVTHTAGTTFGRTATYSCNTGYNLVGDSTRTCQATRVWSGSPPSCQGSYRMLSVLFCTLNVHNKVKSFLNENKNNILTK